MKLKLSLGADDAWLENGWKFPQFSVFFDKGRCLIFGFRDAQVCLLYRVNMKGFMF